MFQWYATLHNVHICLYCKLDFSAVYFCGLLSTALQCVQSKMTWQRWKWAVDPGNYCHTNNCTPLHHCKDDLWNGTKQRDLKIHPFLRTGGFHYEKKSCQPVQLASHQQLHLFTFNSHLISHQQSAHLWEGNNESHQQCHPFAFNLHFLHLLQLLH